MQEFEQQVIHTDQESENLGFSFKIIGQFCPDDYQQAITAMASDLSASLRDSFTPEVAFRTLSKGAKNGRSRISQNEFKEYGQFNEKARLGIALPSHIHVNIRVQVVRYQLGRATNNV
jgi:hypothetical protein